MAAEKREPDVKMDDVEPENAVDPAPQSGAHGTVDTTTAPDVKMDDVEPENAVDPAPQSEAHGTVDTTTAANPVEVNGEAGHHTDGVKLNDEMLQITPKRPRGIQLPFGPELDKALAKRKRDLRPPVPPKKIRGAPVIVNPNTPPAGSASNNNEERDVELDDLPRVTVLKNDPAKKRPRRPGKRRVPGRSAETEKSDNKENDSAAESPVNNSADLSAAPVDTGERIEESGNEASDAERRTADDAVKEADDRNGVPLLAETEKSPDGQPSDTINAPVGQEVGPALTSVDSASTAPDGDAFDTENNDGSNTVPPLTVPESEQLEPPVTEQGGRETVSMDVAASEYADDTHKPMPGVQPKDVEKMPSPVQEPVAVVNDRVERSSGPPMTEPGGSQTAVEGIVTSENANEIHKPKSMSDTKPKDIKKVPLQELAVVVNKRVDPLNGSPVIVPGDTQPKQVQPHPPRLPRVPEPEEPVPVPEFIRKMRNLRRVARQEEREKTTEDDSAATSPSPYPRPKKHVAFHQSDGQKTTQPTPDWAKKADEMTQGYRDGRLRTPVTTRVTAETGSEEFLVMFNRLQLRRNSRDAGPSPTLATTGTRRAEIEKPDNKQNESGSVGVAESPVNDSVFLLEAPEDLTDEQTVYAADNAVPGVKDTEPGFSGTATVAQSAGEEEGLSGPNDVVRADTNVHVRESGNEDSDTEEQKAEDDVPVQKAGDEQ